MANEIYDQLFAGYDLRTANQSWQARYEVNQQIVLAGLEAAGFFNIAAFYGGTCLRVFHGLERFSEDLDFSLLSPSEDFDFSDYFDAIVKAFAVLGRTVEIKKKEKKSFSRVESAFLKDNTKVFDLAFRQDKAIKIKIEVDTNPPLKFSTEQKLLLSPTSCMVTCFTLPSLFAGKMHSLLYRPGKQRIKGRDWFDFEWYIRQGVPLDFTHLHERILQFNGKDLTREDFLLALRERLATANISEVKSEVAPFLRETSRLDVWSNDYFLALAERLRFAE